MKRYYPRGGKKAADMHVSTTGEWVRYDDCIEEINRYKDTLKEIASSNINSFLIEAKHGNSTFTGTERFCSETDVVNLLKIAKKALQRPNQRSVSLSDLSEEERIELATVLQNELEKLK